MDFKLKTYNSEIFYIFVDKYFGTWLLIKHLLYFLDTINQNLNIFCFISIWCKSLFFYEWIHNLCYYSTFKVTISVFFFPLFTLNLKISRILRSTIQSYNPQSWQPCWVEPEGGKVFPSFLIPSFNFTKYQTINTNHSISKN